MAPPKTSKHEWWKESVVYQIYPSSFKDSDGDGLGDLPGIISKVDYLASLGVDAVWISPFFKSPQVDMGYDISDYRAVHEPYGTVDDVDKLIAELKKHKMKLLMDLVINHTSDQHPWFLESKSSLDNPKRDWYIWHKGKSGQHPEPNNWESLFKGSAWTYDKTTDEHYFHIFAIEQPCLNWTNPAVREALYADVHFWLEKGVGGIRMDAINLISKPDDLADAPILHEGYYQSCFALVKNRPQVHEWLREFKEKVVDQYDDLVIIGECGGTDEIEDVLSYIQPERKEMNMIFQFEHTEIDKGPLGMFSPAKWSLADIKRLTQKWQTILRPSWNTFHLENHDGGRSVNRFGFAPSPLHFPAVSKMFAFYNMTLGGTIFLHQGQEIGTPCLSDDVPLEDYKDMATFNEFGKIKALREAAHKRPGEVDMSDVMKEVRLKARDHGRVPLAWNGEEGSGFTTGTPWMTLGSNYKTINVKAQEAQKDSVLNTWRDMIKFRREHVDELVYGGFELVDEAHEQVFAYIRTAESGRKFLVALNWGHLFVKWEVPFVGRKRKLLKKAGSVREAEAGEVVEMGGYSCACWEIVNLDSVVVVSST